MSTTILEPRHARPYDVTRDGCATHGAGTCDMWCAWNVYVGRHDDGRGRCGTAYRVRMTAARRHYRDGREIIVTTRDRGEEIPVYPGMTRNRVTSTPWPELLELVSTWRNRYPHQTFYVMPESVR